MVTLYTKPNCVQCNMTKKTLDQLGVAYESIDMMENEDALALVKEKGFLAAPVVNVGEQWWSGFRPDYLKELVAA